MGELKRKVIKVSGKRINVSTGLHDKYMNGLHQKVKKENIKKLMYIDEVIVDLLSDNSNKPFMICGY